MRIAMLTSWFYPLPSGSGNRFYEIAKRLSNRHEIHVYTTNWEGHEIEETIDGINIHRYGSIDSSKSLERGVMVSNLKFSYSTFLRFVRDNAEKNFDLIDCNITSKTLPFVSYLASRSRHIPLIETWHEVWHMLNLKRSNPLFAPAAFITEYIMPKLADFSIAVSNVTRQRLINLLKTPQERIRVIPNGVDCKAFDKINVKKESNRIVYVGRLEEQKRVDLLILAFNELRKTLPESELFIVGDGSQREYLLRLASALRLKRFFFTGILHRSELIRVLKSSNALVLPSVFEGYGIVLLEAMAAGTPPIAVSSPGSGVTEIVFDGYNGLLVQASVDQIRDALYKLLTNNDLHNHLRENGLNFVKKYDWSNIAGQVANFYEEVVTDGNRWVEEKSST